MPPEAYTETEIEQLLKDYIAQNFLYETPKVVLENDWLLIEEGIINSLGILTLISFIQEQFYISVASEEMSLENFKDINSIKSLVLSKIKALTQPTIIQAYGERKLSSMVLVKQSGSKQPFFYIHGMPGFNVDVSLALARYIDSERPLYAVQAIGLNAQETPHTCIDEMVAHYIREIRFVQPEGPYLLGGVCVGGSIAFEAAQQLKRNGHQVLLLVMVDSPNPFLTEHDLITLANRVSLKIPNWGRELIIRNYRLNQIENPLKLWGANLKAITNHSPQLYQGRVACFIAEESITKECQFDPMQPNGWNRLVADEIQLYKIPGDHFTMHYEPNVKVLAEKLNAYLEEVDQDDRLGNGLNL